jgi:hypothetical protein
MTSAGLPHSGIRGLAPADGSPRLIAAFHALHRLLTPRHPPCALNSSAPRSRTTLSRQDRLTIHYSSLVKERSLPGLSLNVDHRRRPTKGHERDKKIGPTAVGPLALARRPPDYLAGFPIRFEWNGDEMMTLL